MSTRPVVSYDDITLPYDPVEPPAAAPQPSSAHPEQPPPAKKRKKNTQKGKNRANQNQPRGQQQNKLTNGGGKPAAHQYQQQQQQEYDESMQDDYDYSYTGEGDAEVEEGEEEEEESRELTHEEIWDDSALLYAWESAMEEYEAYHGPGQDWKKEPVKKSPLWYNVPPDLSKKAPKAPAATGVSTAAAVDDDEAEADSKPLDFDTFVPTHDPSLYPATSSSSSALPADVAAAAAAMGQAPQVDYVPEAGVPGNVVSQDEAFQRALSATYWAGYWTAMYHAQKQFSQSQKVSIPQASSPEVADQVDAEAEVETEDILEEGEEIEVDNEDEFVSTQR